MLDLRDLNGLEIDVEGRTAWVDGGVTTGRNTAAAAEHGLATPFGYTGSVGISGLTLGGGVGYLVRKHGLTVDSLPAADVVTAAGTLLRADADSHPDLFWALRAGGRQLRGCHTTPAPAARAGRVSVGRPAASRRSPGA